MRYGYNEDAKTPHGQQELPSNLYVVYARKGDVNSCHVCHTFIVHAESEWDAVYRLKENAKVVLLRIEEDYKGSWELQHQKKRMVYLLEEGINFKVTHLKGNRAYPVGYFDDPRDISGI